VVVVVEVQVVDDEGEGRLEGVAGVDVLSVVSAAALESEADGEGEK
jgi:hypothetical protein